MTAPILTTTNPNQGPMPLQGLPLPRKIPGPEPIPVGPDGFGALHNDFIASAGQTVFHLSQPATIPSLILVIVDHEVFFPPNVTVSQTTVTWNPTNTFPLEAGQSVRVYYE